MLTIRLARLFTDGDRPPKHILRFLEEGDKVKVVVMFRGREVVHRDIGFRIIEDVLNRVADKCLVEKPAGIDGRDMHAIIVPRPVEVPKKPKAPKPEDKKPETVLETKQA